MSEFHRGPYETAVGPDELLCELRFPIRPRSGSAYEKVERRVGDWAVGAAGAAVTLAADGTVDDAAVGLTALGLDHTLAEAADVLRGRRPDEELFARGRQAGSGGLRSGGGPARPGRLQTASRR